jgi:hypothetical protein
VTVAGGSATVIVIATDIAGAPLLGVIVTVPVREDPMGALYRTSLKKLTVTGEPNVYAIPPAWLTLIQLGAAGDVTLVVTENETG